MQEYRSKEVVKAVLFDPGNPDAYDDLEELGCLVNRNDGTACTPTLDNILPFCYVMETHPALKLKTMNRATFEGTYERIGQLVS